MSIKRRSQPGIDDHRTLQWDGSLSTSGSDSRVYGLRASQHQKHGRETPQPGGQKIHDANPVRHDSPFT